MATADEIRARIRQKKEQVQEKQLQLAAAHDQEIQARVRQELRKELAAVQEDLQTVESDVYASGVRRVLIDQDDADFVACARSRDSSGADTKSDKVQAEIDCDGAVATGELEWNIKGFSWLREVLDQTEASWAESEQVTVCGHSFCFRYDPNRTASSYHSQRASLAIRHGESDDYMGVVFRYTIWIKSGLQGYIQWGESGNICEPGEQTDLKCYGPDVCDLWTMPKGIFGMTHDELTKSEWVVNDMLQVKLKVQVRPECNYQCKKASSECIQVPPSSLHDDLLVLLDNDEGSDVTFVVKGQSFQAHSLILSARSEVIRRLLVSGMRESTSRRVMIEDCEPEVFSIFLRYLYSDSFALVEDFIEGQAEASSKKMGMLQQFLALGHKYQVLRLQMWCERQMCTCISVENVCFVLCQAYLYEAKQLECKCLDFIKFRMKDVVKTDGFVSLNQEWPQVSLKVSLYNAEVPHNDIAVILEKEQNARKRKRND